MKFTFAFLAVLAATSTVSAKNIPEFGKGELYQDIQDFIDLLPLDNIIEIFIQYAAEDAEFQAALTYILSEDFKQLATDIEEIPEIQELMAYLENAGIEIYMLVNKLNELLGIEKRFPQTHSTMPVISGGLRGLVDDIVAILPIDKIKELYYYKLENSKAFSNFVQQLQSPEFQKIVNTVYANPRFQELLNKGRSAGFDLSIIRELLEKLLGIKVPTVYSTHADNELEKDFQDFVALIPVDEIFAIVITYLSEDQEVQRALAYASSDDFKQMVRDVEALKEYQELVIELTNAGLDVVRYIQTFHQLIGMEDYVPPFFANYQATTGGIRGMIDEIAAILPVEEIKALYHKKLETSKAFAKFVSYLGSEDFKQIINAVYEHEVYLNLISKAKGAGLDLEAISEFFYRLFGIEFPEH